MKPLTSNNNTKDTLYALDDAALLLRLICSLEPPEPEWLPLPMDNPGDQVECRFESPMPADLTSEAIRILEHSAINIAVLQLGLVLGPVCDAAHIAVDSNQRQAQQITQLIQNAYALNPCQPIWRLDGKDKDLSLCVPDVITLDTAGLNEEPVNVLHFGGSDAILKLLAYAHRLLASGA